MACANTDEDNMSCDSWQYKCLWEQICDCLRKQEVEEVRSAIGHEVIERNEELMLEIASITEILSEFREQNNSLENERTKQRQKKRELLSSGSERKLLEEQIKMLLREKAASSQLPSHNDKVLSYLASTDPALSNEDEDLLNMSWLRPDPHSMPNSARPVSALSSSRISARSCPLNNNSLTDEVIGSSKCINANDIGAVVGCLRRGFKKEYEALKEEVAALMAIFDEEDSRANQDNVEIPTTSELREFSSKLQHDSKSMPVTRLLESEGSDPISDSLNKKVLPSLHAHTKNLPVIPALSLNSTRPIGKSSKLSMKFKSEVADAAVTSRDDFHLSDDSGFFM